MKKQFVMAMGLMALSFLLCGLNIYAGAQPSTPESFSPPTVDVLSAEDIVAQWKTELPRLRLQESDVKVPQGWPPEFTIASVERLFEKPLQQPITANRWLSTVENSPPLSETIKMAADILLDSSFLNESQNTNSSSPPLPQSLPPSLAPILKNLYTALSTSQQHLQTAVNSITKEERENFLRFMEVPSHDGTIQQEISGKRIRQSIQAMGNFNLAELMSAGSQLFTSIDEILPLLSALGTQSEDFLSPIFWDTPIGKFLIKGPDSDSFSEKELSDTMVIIDLGGDNTYEGPVAGAKENQIRLVIDLGTNINIKARRYSNSTVASGIFGIGILCLPNPAGSKVISANSFSEGCGIAGIGALLMSGHGELTGDRNSQGVGAYGVGILQVKDSEHSTFELTRNGQGAGFVKGIGIFSLIGNETNIKGGLIQPDPREPLGSVSICQGMGYGKRGYAGGGIGLFSIRGNKNKVEGSYFAQGSGYWHGFGICQIKGNDNVIQARRYDQGTGVHYAFGHFQLEGHRNRILNWGVGPAFGWDRGLGTAVFIGNDNEIQADWGVGTAAIGSWSLSFLKGNRNQLKVPQFASGGIFRNEIAHSLHVIQGSSNTIQSPINFDWDAAVRHMEMGTRDIFLMPTPWGIARTEGLSFQPNLNLKPPEWGRTVNENGGQKEMVNLYREYLRAMQLEGLEKVELLVNVAAAFSLDKDNPLKALTELIYMSKKDIPYLIDVIEPAAVDQLIKLQLILAAHGENAANAIVGKYPSVPLQKKLILLNEMAFLPPSSVVTTLLNEMKSSDSPDRRVSATRVLGHILNTDVGNEPGRKAVLEILANHLKNKTGLKNEPKPLIQILSRLRFIDAFGLLSTIIDLSNENRSAFLASGPEDITETLGDKGAQEFIRQTHMDAKNAQQHIEEELAIIQSIEPVVQESLYELLSSTNPQSIQSAVIVMGQMAKPEDATYLRPLLHHEQSVVREAAAIALARMGKAGLPILKSAFRSSLAQTRNLVLSSINNAIISQTSDLLFLGLEDTNAFVRLNAVAALKNLPPILESTKTRILKKVRRILRNEKDPSVRMALQTVQ